MCVQIAITSVIYAEYFRLEKRSFVERLVYWFDQYIIDSRLVHSRQFTLDFISILGAIVLNTGIIGFEQVMSTFWDFSRNCSPSLTSRTARNPRWPRATCVEAPPRARCRRGPEVEVIGGGKQTAVKDLRSIHWGQEKIAV